MTIIKAAAVQLSPAFHSREDTVAKIVKAILDLGSKGVQFVTFPESSAVGGEKVTRYLPG